MSVRDTTVGNSYRILGGLRGVLWNSLLSGRQVRPAALMSMAETAAATAAATVTVAEQQEVETAVGRIYAAWVLRGGSVNSVTGLRLLRERHVPFLLRGLGRLPSGFSSLDSSRPWLCYWIVHSLALLEEQLDDDMAERCIDTLARCQHPDGGYGGGPGQMAHLATTYAAVMALVSIGGREALSSIDRQSIFSFLCNMKDECGGFRMHHGGEIDARGCYTALAVAHSLRLPLEPLTHRLGDFIQRCQTYEGGIGGEPGAEAHGGYTYCGLAALLLAELDVATILDMDRLQRWLVWRQGSPEGGFQGRTNKLVDGCYSFWQGGVFPLIEIAQARHQQEQKQQHKRQQQQQQMEKHNPETAKRSSDDSDLHTMETNEGAREHEGKREKEGKVMHAAEKPEVDIQHCSAAETAAGGGRLEDCERVASHERQQQGNGGQCSVPQGTERVNEEEEEEEDEDEDGEFLWSDPSAVVFADDAFPPFPLPADSSGETSRCEGKGKEREGDLGDVEGCLGGEVRVGVCYNSRALQAYILLACQLEDGGLRDKPGKPRDYYHTCYCLSGLSAAQYSAAQPLGYQLFSLSTPSTFLGKEGGAYASPAAQIPEVVQAGRAPGAAERAEAFKASPTEACVLGPPTNQLARTDPLCNVVLQRYSEAWAYFKEYGWPSNTT